MFRVLLTLCLAVSLTVCPFRCMGRAFSAEQSPAAPHCCDHCRNSQDSSNTDHLPEPGEPDSSCCDCVCTGAVLAAGHAADHVAADVNVLATAALTMDAFMSAEAFVVFAVHPPPSSELSGGALRLALQSLLI